jgi:hypothetical protein
VKLGGYLGAGGAGMALAILAAFGFSFKAIFVKKYPKHTNRLSC